MLTDPITQQGFQITVDMVVTHEAETADIAFQVDKKFWGEPQAEAGPQKRFKILVGGIDDQGTIFNALMFRGQRKPADIDGYVGDPDGT